MHITTAKVQTQASKDLQPEEPQIWGPESIILTVLPCFNNSEFSAKTQQEKKKNCRWNNQQQHWQDGPTPATGINADKQGEANK